MQLLIIVLVTFFINKVKKMAEKKSRRKKKFQLLGFINFATDHCINENTQKVLDSLTSLPLGKVYYSLFQLDHCGCWCYYCYLKHTVLRTIMDRGGNYKYLNGKLKLDEFEQKDSPHIFYEEWLRKNNIR